MKNNDFYRKWIQGTRPQGRMDGPRKSVGIANDGVHLLVARLGVQMGIRPGDQVEAGVDGNPIGETLTGVVPLNTIGDTQGPLIWS